MRRPIPAILLALLVGGCSMVPDSLMPGSRASASGASASKPAAAAPRSPLSDARLRLADVAESNANVDVASAIYQSALAADPENVDIQTRYARLLATQGRATEALAGLRQNLKRRPSEPGLLLAAARISLRSEDLPAARDFYGRLLEARPGDADALNGLGIVADLSGEHGAAQRHYTAALRKTPDHAGARNNLGLSLALTGRLPESVAHLKAVRDEEGTNPTVRHNYALALAMTGDRKGAREILAADLSSAEIDEFVAAAGVLQAANIRK